MARVERAALPRDANAWDRLPNEGDRAYMAFQTYLDLPKRGAVNKRRYAIDVSTIIGCTEANIIRWSRHYNWELRADEYDRFRINRPVELEELAARREFAGEIRKNAKEFRELAVRRLKSLKGKDLPPDELRQWYKLGLDAEQMALRLEQPKADEEKNRLVAEVRELIGRLGSARELGDDADRTVAGAVTATERTVSIEVRRNGKRRRERPVYEVPALPGSVCEGSAEPDVVDEGSRDSASRQRSAEGGG